MPNLRIIYDNALDRAASLAASNTQGSLVVSNLQNDYKGVTHRSTGTSVSYTITWTNIQQISGLVLPATNLTTSSILRLRLYTNAADSVPVYDSSNRNTVHQSVHSQWPIALTANTFAYGGLTKASFWLNNPINARKAIIDLTDTSNPAGFIDCSRIVIGSYWSPTYNFEPGLVITRQDNSTATRLDSGDLFIDRSFVNDRLSFNYSYLTEADFKSLNTIVSLAGRSKRVAISMLPEYSDKSVEAEYLVYGLVAADTQFNYVIHKYYKSSLEINGW
jgi:hypothetical protein